MRLDNDTLREQLAATMRRKGVSAYKLAAELGVSRQTIKNYLLGHTDHLSSDTLMRMMDRLGFVVLTPEELTSVNITIF